MKQCHAIPWDACAALVGCGTIGLLADRTRLGKALSGPVCAMLVAAVASNLGLLPSSTKEAVPLLQTFTVKLATPLLLFSADLRRVAAGARDLLPAFALGTAGTLLGALVADALLHDRLLALGDALGGRAAAGLDLAGALSAKNIGGGLNYVAVASALEVPRALFTAGIAIDNIAALIYFPLVSALGSLSWMTSAAPLPSSSAKDTLPGTTNTTNKSNEDASEAPEQPDSDATAAAAATSAAATEDGDVSRGQAMKDDDPAEKVMLTMAVAFAIVALTEPLGRAALPASTAVTVALATALPSSVGRLAPQADMLGKVLLFVFFASAGAAADSIRSSLGFTVLFVFLAVLYAVHLGVMVIIGRLLLQMDGRALLICSNANIGGPATAASLASAKGWDHLLVPGVLAGNLGNAVATFLGIALAGILQR